MNAVYVTMLDTMTSMFLSFVEVEQRWNETFKWGSMAFPDFESWGMDSDVSALAAIDAALAT